MSFSTASLSYRKAALQQASTVGLVIALYDTLVGSLSRAAVAMENTNIELRCSELKHGFKVLQQLDFMLDLENGGATAVELRRFYGHLRGQMLAAQFKLSAAILREQIKAVLIVREAWQQVDSRGALSVQSSPAEGALDFNPWKATLSHGVPLRQDSEDSFSCSG